MMEEKKEFLELHIEPREEKAADVEFWEVSLKGWAWGEKKRIYLVQESAEKQKTAGHEAQLLKLPELGKALIIDEFLFTTPQDEKLAQEALVYPSALTHTAPKKILLIGGETGGALRELLKLPDLESVTVLSRDEELADFCRRHFSEVLGENGGSPKVNLLNSNAVEHLSENPQVYDLILVDGAEIRSGQEMTGADREELYRLIAGALKKLGIFAINLGRLDFPVASSSLVRDHYQDARNFFAKTVVYHEFMPGPSVLNAFMAGSRLFSPAVLTPPEIDRRIKERKISDLRYYDGALHQRMFLNPSWLKKHLEA